MNGCNENNVVSNDPCFECSTNLVESGKENNVEYGNTNMECTKMDGLQEHPTLEEELNLELYPFVFLYLVLYYVTRFG
jgi:hypothetical protein